MTTSRLRELANLHWPYLFTTAAPAILFAPFLLGRVVLYFATPLYQFYPWRKFALDMIRAGQLPLWNPYVGNGAPLIANYQSALFYPPNWLSLILPLGYSFSWLAVLHLIWAGAGMVTFARSLGLRPFGQVVAGLAFGMSQYLVARAGFLSINSAAAWLPWILWAADRTLMIESSRAAVRYGILLCIFAAFQLLAGHAQITWYSFLLLGAWIGYRWLANRPLSIYRAGILAAAILLAAGLATIQLLPTAEYLRQSPRASAYEYEKALAYSFPPLQLLTMIAPDLFGNPARNLFFGYVNYWENANYIGILPFLLAATSLGWRLRGARRAPEPTAASGSDPPRSLVPFLGLATLLAFMLALGQNTPIFPFLYHHIPTFSMFQAPTRWMIWFEFGLALVAGIAADEWTPPGARLRYWIRLGLVAALTLAAVGTAILLVLPAGGEIGRQIHAMAGAVAVAGIGLVISAILALRQPPPDSPRRRMWTRAVAAFVTLDLIYANWGINPGAPPELYQSQAPASTPSTGGHRLFEYLTDEQEIKYGHFITFDSFGPVAQAFESRASQIANVNYLNGLRTANNYDPLVVQRYYAFLEIAGERRTPNLLRLMDVSQVIVFKDGKIGFEPIQGPRRAWLVTSARMVADSDAARLAIAEPDFDPGGTVILEADDRGIVAEHSVRFDKPPAPIAEPGAQILDDQANVIKVSVSLMDGGWLVLSDTYYPGWFAFVDGQPAKLLHADFAFRAVAVRKGEHLIEFRYEPSSFKLGAQISAISLLMLLVLLIIHGKASARISE